MIDSVNYYKYFAIFHWLKASGVNQLWEQLFHWFGFSMMRIIIMQISVAFIHVNGLLDLDNSSHHTMPHWIIAKSKY